MGYRHHGKNIYIGYNGKICKDEYVEKIFR